MVKYLRRPVVIVLALLGCVLLVGIAQASWRQLDQIYINDQLVCRDGMRFGVALAEFGGATTTSPITTTFGVALNTSGRPAPNQGQVCCGGSAYGPYLVPPRTLTLPYSSTPITITPPGGFSVPSNHVLANGLVRFNQVVAAGSNVVVTLPGQVQGTPNTPVPGAPGVKYDGAGFANLNDAGRYQFPVQDCSIYSDLRLAMSDQASPITVGENISYDLTLTNNGSAPLVSRASQESTGGLIVPDEGASTPYPSTIEIAHMTGRIARVQVVLKGITHGNAGDLDVLLVAPDGSNTLLMSDAGEGQTLSNTTLTFDDTAATSLPSGTTPAISTAYYRPTNYDSSDDFSPGGGPSPSDPLPYGDKLAMLKDGTPNGQWRLYVLDDAAGSSGTIAGWRLNITTEATPITVRNTLPAGFTLISATGPAWTCQPSTTMVSCTYTAAILPVATAQTIHVVAKVPMVVGQYTNHAALFSPVPDTNTQNNDASRVITVRPRERLVYLPYIRK